MKRVTLRFPSLQLMADCMFQIGITRPVINYEQYFLTADLSEKQIEQAKDCQAEIVEIIVAE
jgi:hypothetical protein